MRYIYKAAHDQKALESQVIKTLTDRSLSGDAYKAICIVLEPAWVCSVLFGAGQTHRDPQTSPIIIPARARHELNSAGM